jgi:hypothetical protein
MDNRWNEIRRKISFLRSEMLATEDIIRKQINRDEDCTEASLRLMAMIGLTRIFRLAVRRRTHAPHGTRRQRPRFADHHSRHPRFEMYQAQERSCVPVRKAPPSWRGARDDCAWLLSAGYIDGYTRKITIRRIVLNQ